jgi:hypothetical protein
MAGFEVVVRPAVLPNIRPGPARVLPPADDATKGICTIGGSGGGLIDLQYSFSASYSSNSPEHETKRQVDNERVYQKDEKGNINKKNYVDVERLKKVRFDTERGPVKMIFSNPPNPDNVKTLEKNKTIPFVDEDFMDTIG